VLSTAAASFYTLACGCTEAEGKEPLQPIEQSGA
jgi:hypothetical protein